MAAIHLISFPDMVFPLRTGIGTLAVTLSLETVNYGKSLPLVFMYDLQLCNNTDMQNTPTAANCNIIAFIDITIEPSFQSDFSVGARIAEPA